MFFCTRRRILVYKIRLSRKRFFRTRRSVTAVVCRRCPLTTVLTVVGFFFSSFAFYSRYSCVKQPLLRHARVFADQGLMRNRPRAVAAIAAAAERPFLRASPAGATSAVPGAQNDRAATSRVMAAATNVLHPFTTRPARYRAHETPHRSIAHTTGCRKY